MAAAVADFRPVAVADQKLKKAEGVPAIVLEPTEDILAELGALPSPTARPRRLRGRDHRCRRQRAGRSSSERGRPARGQRRRGTGTGFEHDTNAVTIFDAVGGVTEVALASKDEVADAGPRRHRVHRLSSPVRQIAIPDLSVNIRQQGAPVSRWTFTSESVTEGHPDKMADQISDAVLDAILAEDPMARVACETLVTTGLVVVAGEITTSAYVEFPKIVRDTVNGIGFDNGNTGFDGNTCGVITSIDPSRPTSPRASTPRTRPAPARPVRTSSTSRAPATRG
jgi:hypothetical protein